MRKKLKNQNFYRKNTREHLVHQGNQDISIEVKDDKRKMRIHLYRREKCLRKTKSASANRINMK